MRALLLALARAFAPVALRAEIAIKEVTSPGGINAWLVESPDIPFLALEIRIRGGSNLDDPARRGATNLMMALVEEGAGDMDAQAFQTAREELAASFGFRAFDDSIAISAQVIAGIQSDALDPQTIASDTLAAAAYPGHPYGSNQSGTVDTVTTLTRDDLLAAHRAAFVRDRIYVAAVGDITAAELGPLLDHLLGALPAEGPPLPPHVPFGLPGGITVVDFPSPQSTALFGQSGITRDDPDYFTAHVLNHILGGGGFESRLMQEVREKRGLTYGIGTYLVPRDYSESILGSVASANDTMAEAIEVIRAEWARMATEGVSAEELAAAKTYITGEYPLRFDGNAQIAEIMVGMQMIDLPPDYVVNRNAYIEAVTQEDVARVAADLLDPEALHFVVVGQPVALTTD